MPENPTHHAEAIAPVEKTADVFEHLAKGPSRLLKFTKDGETIYIDSTDLTRHEAEARQLLENGWEHSEELELPAYLPTRRKAIEESGFTPAGWGYQKE